MTHQKYPSIFIFVLLTILTQSTLAAPVRVGVMQPWGNGREDPWSSSYNPANVRPKVQQNINKILNLLDKAGQKGCDIVCTPEDIAGLAAYGYYPYNELPGEWDPIIKSLIEPVPNATTNQIAAIAAKHSMYIIACMYTKESDGKYYNSALFFDRSGTITGTYHKIHLPAFEEWSLTPGNSLPVFNTDFGPVGAIICYDISFPEASLAYGLKGVNLLFHPTMAMEYWDGGNTLQYAIPLRMRAADGRFYVASSNYGNGAGFVDPAGKVLQEAPGANDTVLVRDIDLSVELRETSAWWNAIWGTDLIRAMQVLKRNPSAYSILSASSSPITQRYSGVNIITSADTLAMAAAVEKINYSNHPFFTSTNTVEIPQGYTLDYTVRYGNPTGAAVSLTYLKVPTWANAGGTIVHGTSPSAPGTDTLRVALTAGAYRETLTVRIIINTTTGGSLQKASATYSRALDVVPVRTASGHLNFTVVSKVTGDLSLSVFGIDGRKVWGYDQKNAGEGVHSILWDKIPLFKKSRTGPSQPVASGQYILLVKQNSTAITRNLSILN